MSGPAVYQPESERRSGVTTRPRTPIPKRTYLTGLAIIAFLVIPLSLTPVFLSSNAGLLATVQVGAGVVLLGTGFWYAYRTLYAPLERSMDHLSDSLLGLQPDSAPAWSPAFGLPVIDRISEHVHGVVRHLRREIERLLHEAMMDPICGSFNMRYLETHGPKVYLEATRTAQPISLLMVSVHQVGAVVETMGYVAGNKVLRYAADLIKTSLRPSDQLVRLHGGEFLVLMPHTPVVQAVAVGKEIATALAAGAVHVGPLNGPDRPVMLAASIGAVSTWLGKWRSFWDLTMAARQAMRHAGPHQVEVWQPNLPASVIREGFAQQMSTQFGKNLHAVLLRLLTSPDPDTVLRVMLEASLEVCGADYGAVFRFDQKERVLRYSISVGVPPDLDRKQRDRPPWRFGEERGITGLVAQIGQPLYLPNVLADPRWTGSSQRIQSAIWVPLVIGPEVFGVFNVLSHRVDGLTQEGREFVITMAGYATLTLERQARRQELEEALDLERSLTSAVRLMEEARDPEAIGRAGLEQGLRRSGMDVGAFFVVDDEAIRLAWTTGRTDSRSPGVLQSAGHSYESGAIGEAVRGNRPVFLDNYPSSSLAETRWVEAGIGSLAAVPLSEGDKVVGVLALFALGRKVSLAPTLRTWLESLAIRMTNAYAQSQAVRRAEAHREEALAVVGRALELRDYETQGHTERVARLAVLMARRVSPDPEFEQGVYWGALLHDIGKLAVPDPILRKPGPLTPEERGQMQHHAAAGAEIARRLGFLPQSTIDVVQHHHERWDGTGYPDGLAAEQIPLAARLFAVVDCYDALRSARPYKVAWSGYRALQYMKEQSGSQFDPAMVRILRVLIKANVTDGASGAVPVPQV
jgi:diguanylate cyclase (GGDEF)-like protein/putative nucleotidyltransferase with HDIG domain